MSLNELTALLARQDAVLVRVQATQGSVPRGAGAWMAVFADGVVGTIGGGRLEFEAIGQARRRLAAREGEDDGKGAGADENGNLQRYSLGPSLGQCCGGVVQLHYQRITTPDLAALQGGLAPPLRPLALFGGGHVGKALVNVLATLPFAVRWIDSRDEIFPPALPGNVACEYSDPVQAAVADLTSGSMVLVMSFSHAEDLDVVAACLTRLRERQDLPYVGLIGSKTKWATFRHRLAQRGFDAHELAQITCPIGLPGIRGKQPEVIAVSVAAQLLQLRSEGPA